MEKDTTLLEKEVKCLEISDGEISGTHESSAFGAPKTHWFSIVLKNQKFLTDAKKTLNLEKESAAKLFSKFKLDFNYKPFVQSSPSCSGSAYSFMLKEKPLYLSALDRGIQRLENPLGSAYANMFGSSSYGLPCDFGLLR